MEIEVTDTRWIWSEKLTYMDGVLEVIEYIRLDDSSIWCRFAAYFDNDDYVERDDEWSLVVRSGGGWRTETEVGMGEYHYDSLVREIDAHEERVRNDDLSEAYGVI